jgi:uncharacterized protein YifE (UPF0438 family)
MPDEPTLKQDTVEQSLINTWLWFYKELDSGERKPKSQAQQHFVEVCRGQTRAETQDEFAYVKFRMNVAHERENERSGRLREQSLDSDSGGISEFGEGNPRPGFFTDKGWREMRRGYLSDCGFSN